MQLFKSCFSLCDLWSLVEEGGRGIPSRKLTVPRIHGLVPSPARRTASQQGKEFNAKDLPSRMQLPEINAERKSSPSKVQHPAVSANGLCT